MTERALLRRWVRRLQAWDRRLTRRPDVRRILVDARTPVNYTMFAPVYERMRQDPRLRFYFTASDEPGRRGEIYAQAPKHVRVIGPWTAAAMKFDAYVASDFMWAALPRGTVRVQVFHGVAGKYGFDAPTDDMRGWDRLFFVNERRLLNFVGAGAVDADSPAIRLIGMPKVDCLVDGSLRREPVLERLGLDPGRPTVLYAPTWSPASSLNLFGTELVRRLPQLGVNLIVKLHDRSRDLRPQYSGGIDWAARLAPVLARGLAALGHESDICPYLAAADVMITDHSSAGFEFLLRDRPLVRIHLPALIAQANIHPDYVALLSEAAASTGGLDDTLRAVEDALAQPRRKAAERQRVAGELFYRPGGATARSAAALYELLELQPVAPAVETLAPGVAASVSGIQGVPQS